MAYIVTIATSVVSGMLVFILQGVIRENRRLKKEKEEKQAIEGKALKDGVLCLLRTKMIEYHTKYIELGYISSHAYSNWCLIYQAYISLGGNGMIKHMNEEIEELHLKRTKD